MIKLSESELTYKFIEHKKWIDSLGKEGKRLSIEEIDLRENSIDRGIFKQAYITECIFDDKNIKDISFYLSKLWSSSFHRCILKKIDFTKADLSYTNFSNSYLCDVNFSKCECIETNFNNSKFINIKMTDVLFDAADLRNVTMYNVDISYSTFEAVLVKGISFKNITGIENVSIVSIDIGDEILQGDEAIQWFNDKMS